MEFISNCTADAISNAAKALIDGRLVAFPTETVYGLGADATNEKAVSRIYSVKGRPTDHPLIVHISSINKLEDWATNIPEYAIKLAKEFWPGPMTLILPRKDKAKDFITGGQNNVGLRVPDQPIALSLLRKFEELGGQGVAAPSANRFGAVSPTTAEAVYEEICEYLNLDDLVLDGGPSSIGIESTIIDCTSNEPKLLRKGYISKTNIEQLSNIIICSKLNPTNIRHSGKIESHYAPKSKIKINSIPRIGDGLIALSEVPTPSGVIRLASPKSISDFAHQLYQAYRNADKLGLETTVVMINEIDEFSEAVLDRVEKSSKK
jgi:L-threonylcarbamoyladenylate synthase